MQSMTVPDIVVTVVVAVLVLGGAFFMLTAAVSMFRAHDALARINVLSPATGLGLPMIVLGAYIQHVWVGGFSVLVLIKVVMTIIALIIVSSVGSNVLARAAYLSGAAVDPRTSPQELAEDPDRS
ncbi:cation:proton antiporter [Devriesea agamarum]|uniref:cation:proton antiporter n=1 Tax=Devriesea agamarum TaxID=472569 RepID=UPI000AB54B33|nr:monovalent cation/H(+) antiporter subunit G [Devriesea agamarum]